eukprot:scaffold64513_cov34-Phaeocystis_antarctica.AAC.2
MTPPPRPPPQRGSATPRTGTCLAGGRADGWHSIPRCLGRPAERTPVPAGGIGSSTPREEAGRRRPKWQAARSSGAAEEPARGPAPGARSGGAAGPALRCRAPRRCCTTGRTSRTACSRAARARPPTGADPCRTPARRRVPPP